MVILLEVTNYYYKMQFSFRFTNKHSVYIFNPIQDSLANMPLVLDLMLGWPDVQFWTKLSSFWAIF